MTVTVLAKPEQKTATHIVTTKQETSVAKIDSSVPVTDQNQLRVGTNRDDPPLSTYREAEAIRPLNRRNDALTLDSRPFLLFRDANL